MKKKFKSRKQFNFFKYFYILIVILFLGVILRLLLSIKVFDVDVVSLLEQSNICSSINVETLLMNSMSRIVKFDINQPDTILQNVMFYESSNDVQNYYYINNDVYEIDSVQESVSDSLPLVYIYNSHDTEEYADGYTVYEASFYLKSKLHELGINSIVEENRTSDIRNSNGWSYDLSYKASRINLQKTKNENSSIQIFIDLHRDSVSKKYTSVTIGDKCYAKVLFVVGQEHNNYLDNLFFTQAIDDVIVRDYQNLSKGILQKSGYGVNGIYNQDVGYNVILMEVGGNENTSDEVFNTLDVMANVIKEKLYE